MPDKKEYVPYGEEWEKEMMKMSKEKLLTFFNITGMTCTKKQLIEIIRYALTKGD